MFISSNKFAIYVCSVLLSTLKQPNILLHKTRQQKVYKTLLLAPNRPKLTGNNCVVTTYQTSPCAFATPTPGPTLNPFHPAPTSAPLKLNEF